MIPERDHLFGWLIYQNRAGKSRKSGSGQVQIVVFVLVYLSAGRHHFLFETEVARPVRAQLLDIKGFFLLPGPAYRKHLAGF